MIQFFTILIAITGIFSGLPISTYAQEPEIYISELYFQKSHLSSRDKWIELYNPSSSTVPLEKYSLSIGKSEYIFPLTKNNNKASIPPFSYYIIQDSWGSEKHLLDINNIKADDYSGRAHWISNVSDNPHITVKLLHEQKVTQSISYTSNQTLNFLSNPKTSLECNPNNCSLSNNQFRSYNISPRGISIPLSPQQPKAKPEPIAVIPKPTSTPTQPSPEIQNSEPVEQPIAEPIKSPVLATTDEKIAITETLEPFKNQAPAIITETTSSPILTVSRELQTQNETVTVPVSNPSRQPVGATQPTTPATTINKIPVKISPLATDLNKTVITPIEEISIATHLSLDKEKLVETQPTTPTLEFHHQFVLLLSIVQILYLFTNHKSQPNYLTKPRSVLNLKFNYV